MFGKKTAEVPEGWESMDRWERVRRFEMEQWYQNRRHELSMDLRTYAWLTASGLAIAGIVIAFIFGAMEPVAGAIIGAMAGAAVVGAVLTRWLRIECSYLERLVWDGRDYVRYDLKAQVNDVGEKVKALTKVIERQEGPEKVKQRMDDEAMIADARTLYQVLDFCGVGCDFPVGYADRVGDEPARSLRAAAAGGRHEGKS